MKRFTMVLSLCIAALNAEAHAGNAFRRLPAAEYVDKMTAGWIGQMAGVGWGGPTEFRYLGEIMPAEAVPEWRPEMINQFQQDDLYVEMTFLRTLELRGLDVSAKRAGLDFADSRYPLWHANNAGRTNLRRGIAPPDSGHPRVNAHADDIDYQIEADFAGLIAPGLPNRVIGLGETFGRLMNYGDGLYGGLFVGGMYAEAFFEDDMEAVVRAGLRCVPEGSQYHECISDVLRWYARNPKDWQAAWAKIEAKYQDNPAYRKASCGGPDTDFNIDAKINGAYIVMGLLYGGGHPDATIAISTRCGQDSDCNPSNAAGVLFTSMGYANLPDKFTSGLVRDREFLHTAYSFHELTAVCQDLARQAVLRSGGRIETGADGGDVFVIPVREVEPPPLEQCWAPGPIANSVYTEEELATLTIGKATAEGYVDLSGALEEFAPGWAGRHCGWDMSPGLYPAYRGREGVLLTHPGGRETACALTRTVEVPQPGATLRFAVSHHPDGDWLLVVKANGDVVFEQPVGPGTVQNGWLEVELDLSPYAGRAVELELLNQPTGWMCEAGYWDCLEVVAAE